MPWLQNLNLTRRRLGALAVLCILAVGGGLAYKLQAPATYSATGTVFVARVEPTDSGGSVSTAIAYFETVLKLPGTINRVSTETKISRQALASGLKVSQVTLSPAATVSFTSTSPTDARAAVVAAATLALQTLASQQVDAATDQLTAAQRAVDAAQASVVAFNSALGVSDFGTEYQNEEQNQLNLEDALAAASPQQVGPIQAAIRAQNEQLGRLAAAEPRWQLLDQALTEAQSEYEVAGQALTTAQGYVTAASSPTVLTPPQVTRQSRAALAIRLGLTSGVVMAILGLGVFFGMGVLSRREPDAVRGQLRSPASDPSSTPVSPETNPEPEIERRATSRRPARNAVGRAERSPLPPALGATDNPPIRPNPSPRSQAARNGLGSDSSSRSATRRDGAKAGGNAVDPSTSSGLLRDERAAPRRRASDGAIRRGVDQPNGD